MDKKFGVGHFYHGWVFHVFAVYCYVTNSSQTDLLKAATVFYSACESGIQNKHGLLCNAWDASAGGWNHLKAWFTHSWVILASAWNIYTPFTIWGLTPGWAKGQITTHCLYFLAREAQQCRFFHFLGQPRLLQKPARVMGAIGDPSPEGISFLVLRKADARGGTSASHLGKIQSTHIICLLTFLLVSPSASKVTCTCKKKKKVSKVQIYPPEWVSSPTSLSQLLSVERNTTAWRCFLCARHTYRQMGCSTPLTLSCSLLFLFVTWQAELRVNPQKPPDIKPWLSACGSALK